MPVYSVSPHITEKSVLLAKNDKYTFRVSQNLSAPEVATIVHSLYNVHPLRVSVVKNAAKTKGSLKTKRTRAARIKAIVTVKKGEKIAEFVIEEKK